MYHIVLQWPYIIFLYCLCYVSVFLIFVIYKNDVHYSLFLCKYLTDIKSTKYFKILIQNILDDKFKMLTDSKNVHCKMHADSVRTQVTFYSQGIKNRKLNKHVREST